MIWRWCVKISAQIWRRLRVNGKRQDSSTPWQKGAVERGEAPAVIYAHTGHELVAWFRNNNNPLLFHLLDISIVSLTMLVRPTACLALTFSSRQRGRLDGPHGASFNSRRRFRAELVRPADATISHSFTKPRQDAVLKHWPLCESSSPLTRWDLSPPDFP